MTHGLTIWQGPLTYFRLYLVDWTEKGSSNQSVIDAESSVRLDAETYGEVYIR